MITLSDIEQEYPRATRVVMATRRGADKQEIHIQQPGQPDTELWILGDKRIYRGPTDTSPQAFILKHANEKMIVRVWERSWRETYSSNGEGWVGQ